MSENFRNLETPYPHRYHLWDKMVYRYPDQISAERFLAAFKNYSNLYPDHYLKRHSDYDILLRLFSYKFPSSPIPKERYRFLDHAIRNDSNLADHFVVHHIIEFCISSSLYEIFEDEGPEKKSDSWCSGIWSRIFNSTLYSKSTEGSLCLSRRIREGCVRRGDMGELVAFWERWVPLTWRGVLYQDFRQLQLALCKLNVGDGRHGRREFESLVVDWCRRGFGTVHYLLVEEIGRTLASTEDFDLLADCMKWIPTSEIAGVLKGAKKVFEEKGNVKGFVDWASNWPVMSLGEMHELLREMSRC
jgi:hypothetical protein